jgi:hypothetical protein
MPIAEQWTDQDTYTTVWTGEISNVDLHHSLQRMLDSLCEHDDGKLDLVLDISEADNIPFDAPYLTLRSGVLTRHNTGRVVIIGRTIWAQLMADIVQKVSHNEVIFVPTQQIAQEYLADRL